MNELQSHHAFSLHFSGVLSGSARPGLKRFLGLASAWYKHGFEAFHYKPGVEPQKKIRCRGLSMKMENS
jgi:hypothetical protein